MLSDHPVFPILLSTDLDATRAFYHETLGLEIIREDNLPIRKVVVASSQAVYSEGAAHCPSHGLVFPATRPLADLRAGDWRVRCPRKAAVYSPIPR